MMGGFGSGRPSGLGRRKVEACRSIDVDRLHRDGCLKPGSRCDSYWTRDGERVGSIHLRAEADWLHLTHRVRIGGGEWEDVTETVDIIRVPCRLGGARPYFVCPGVVNGTACRRRVAKLYGPGRYFLCRHCYRLAYASQSQDELGRLRRRANKAWQRLGGDPGTDSEFPPRPKGMWRRTYERLCGEAVEAEERADDALLPYLARLLEQTGHLQTNNDKGKRSFWK
jgi:hypothetical protein